MMYFCSQQGDKSSYRTTAVTMSNGMTWVHPQNRPVSLGNTDSVHLSSRVHGYPSLIERCELKLNQGAQSINKRTLKI